MPEDNRRKAWRRYESSAIAPAKPRLLSRAIRLSGRKALLVVGHVKDPAYCRQLVDTARKEFGRLDILVNNAAY